MQQIVLTAYQAVYQNVLNAIWDIAYIKAFAILLAQFLHTLIMVNAYLAQVDV